ncbi:hypothetical protein BN7_77 [Wickerhamomyces ciferrii]|uniref:Flavin reductase like domain-containing protein n=1 Tax=Wickerhamomyces ciferrii (strain ATCC 14091 / BCRC 22168 / CBS 111 / JCM 3599 / NBRC 0793 / NRRL Y-1031 F-60-10) TaxID=1206466 RepID=K0KGH5_WICCF|nr:uncharacterized protein BN7_77 [Wickerhamomyces ciferrii]CCH40544.1 hypothetical protein BN7_77 [Wickerhamomyces ciferrii]
MSSEKLEHQFDPNWVIGQGATNDDWKNHKKIDIDIENAEDYRENYRLFISGIVPRPVAFISTIDDQGNQNLAPAFSFFNIVSSNPPVFTIGISKNASRDDGTKDTLENILQTKELTINIISEWFIDAANYTSIPSKAGVDEFKLSNLTPSPSKKVKAPHVAESAFSIEAKLLSTNEWKSKHNPEQTSGTLVIVEGVHSWVREDILNKDRKTIDISKLKPVGRLGAINYTTIQDNGYPITRPDPGYAFTTEK